MDSDKVESLCVKSCGRWKRKPIKGYARWQVTIPFVPKKGL